jgi:hypothetical protein
MFRHKISLDFIGVSLCAAGLVVGLNLFIFSLPYVGFGVWPQSEIAIAAMHFCAGICAAGLLFLAPRHKILLRLFVHPLVWLPLLIAVFSLVFMPWHALPVRHLLGDARTGEGVAWWFDWSIFSAAGLLLCRFSRWRKILSAAAFASFFITFVLCMANHYAGNFFTPYFYPDFLAFPLLCLIPIGWSLFRQPAGFSKRWLVVYLLFGLLAFLTQNNVVMAFGIFGFGFFLVLWGLPFLREHQKRRLATGALCFVPLAVLALFVVFMSIDFEAGYYGFGKSRMVNTLVSRAYLIETALFSLDGHPLAIFIGQGWGTFVESFTTHLPHWLDFTKEGSRQWEGLRTDHFHTHNMFVETFYSAGIFAAVALYLYFVSMAVYARSSYKLPAYIFAGGIISLASFWFLLPLNVPFIALAATINARGVRARIPKLSGNYSKRVAVVIVCVALGVEFVAGVITLQTALTARKYLPQMLTPAEAMQNCPMDYRDFSAGGLQLSKMLIGRSRYISARLEELEKKERLDKAREEIPEELLRLNHLFCQSENYRIAHEHVSARLQIARLIVRGETLIGLGPWLDPETRAYYSDGWEEELAAWLARAPARSDQAVPFLLWHMMQGREKKVGEIAEDIYAQDKQDPVGLWFKGMVMTGAPGSAQAGLVFMRRALANGIERYIPVDEDIKNQLTSVP